MTDSPRFYMRLPPGPSAPALIQTLRWGLDPTAFLLDCAARYGEIFQFQVTSFGNAVILSNPEHIKEVFEGSPDLFLAGRAKEFMRPCLGDHSLFVLDGSEHARHRKLLAPVFHGERMHAYGRTMLALTHAAIDRWPLGRTFTLHPEFLRITLQVILHTIFGVAEGPMLERLSVITHDIVDIVANPVLLFPALQREAWGLGPWGRFRRRSRELDQILQAEITRRRQDPATKERTDMLSLLLGVCDEQGTPMSYAEIRDELLTMLVAGHETTASALAWATCILLCDADLCQRLRGELSSATQNGLLSPGKLARLELLDATVRESLRRWPIVPMVGRLVTKPIQLGGYDIPAGWAIGPGIVLAHHRPSAFPEPDRIDPTRFLRSRPSPYEWLPFGGGNRRCIGAAFAMYEMKMVLAALLSRADLTLAKGYVPHPTRRSVTIAPSKQLPVILTGRRQAN